MKTIDQIENAVICGDSLQELKNIPDKIVSLTITSPPYNLGISYNTHQDDQPYAEYIQWLKSIFAEVYRVTRDGGRCAINIDAMTNRQEDRDKEYIRNIYADLSFVMKEIGWLFRSEICWYKHQAVGKATAWGSFASCSNPIIRRNHEYVLVFSKGNWLLEGDNEMSDMTKEEFCEYTLSTWIIKPETTKPGGHPVPFPPELVKRLVKLYCYRDDLVLDPFNGSGTTTYVAKMLKRKYLGIDMDKKYCDYAKNRTESYVDLFDDYVPRSKRLEITKNSKKEEIPVDLFSND
jgi:modification methylase